MADTQTTAFMTLRERSDVKRVKKKKPLYK